MAPQATILSMKVKQILRLYHQFGHLFTSPRLSADEIGQALESRGLIEWVEYGPDGRPLRYRECPAMRDIPKKSFDAEITALVRNYFGHK